MRFTSYMRNTLLAILLTLLFRKWLIYSAGRLFGSYLRRKTVPRQKSILKRVKIEEKAVESFYRKKSKYEDDDWEKVESHCTTSDTIGGQSDDEWEGIVGFFHPFWFVLSKPWSSVGVLMVDQ